MGHATSGELVRRLEEAARYVAVGARYVHYKHPARQYEVTALAIVEATEEVAVVYRALYGDELTFIRPLQNWLAVVETGEGRRVQRFMRA